MCCCSFLFVNQSVQLCNVPLLLCGTTAHLVNPENTLSITTCIFILCCYSNGQDNSANRHKLKEFFTFKVKILFMVFIDLSTCSACFSNYCVIGRLPLIAILRIQPLNKNGLYITALSHDIYQCVMCENRCSQ